MPQSRHSRTGLAGLWAFVFCAAAHIPTIAATIPPADLQAAKSARRAPRVADDSWRRTAGVLFV